MLIVFAVAIFVSAALLFLVQPMVARMLLPLLGGTPAVWNTCMVFFQAVLLGGYLYAHWLTRVRRPAVQVAIHGVVCLLPLALLPVGLREGAGPSGEGWPLGWMLATLAGAVGGPFFVLSATGPLLQRWFSTTDHRAARDPYFLYAASNAGSLIALLGYPFVVEPFLALKCQSATWSVGYVALAVMLVLAGVLAVRRRGDGVAADRPSVGLGGGVSWRTRGLWVLLAFVPSSLMLGATSFISTDLAAVPLLWILPLTAYLLTMILAFSGAGPAATGVAGVLMPVLVVAAVGTMLVRLSSPIGAIVGLHVVLLLAGAMACHGRLAALRPAPERLTEYFLLVSVGGVLGGVFNALVAPVVFNSVYEYPVAIALACWLGMPWRLWGRRPAGEGHSWTLGAMALDVVVPAAVALLVFVTVRVTVREELKGLPNFLVGMGPSLAGCAALFWRPRGFAVCAGVLLAIAVRFAGSGTMLHAERSFFGVHRVMDVPGGHYRKLLHGSTNHGVQALDEGQRGTPLTYYTKGGPAGQVFEWLNGTWRLHEVGLVGLGTGTLAAYARPGQRFTYYEIDPVVVRLAKEEKYFTYLSGSAGEVRTVLGDGKLSLERDREARYDLIVLDAFSSDAIPVHLLTVEAFNVYLSRLNERGVLLVHLSNRHLDLTGVVGGVASRLGLTARINDDKATPEESRGWKSESVWAVVVRDRADLGALGLDNRWAVIAGEGIVWTDDYSNIVEVLKR